MHVLYDSFLWDLGLRTIPTDCSRNMYISIRKKKQLSVDLDCLYNLYCSNIQVDKSPHLEPAVASPLTTIAPSSI